MRNASLSDSSFRARKLADDERVLCASPAYLAEHGTPAHPQDLQQHQLIAFKDRSIKELKAKTSSQRGSFDPNTTSCRLVLDDGLSQKNATIAGAGISINSLWSVHQELRDGTLIRILTDYQVDEKTALWLVYPKSNVLTAKVRLFIDFLLQRIASQPVWET